MEQKKKQDHKFYGGFRYAIEGILTGIRQEQNMKMHCIMTVELVNTSVEAVVDLVTEKRKPLAKIAKDTAAGAVLIAALFSAVIGCIIFVPKIMEWFTFF